MEESQIFKYIQNMDIYLIDQIMKQKYRRNDRILDAGCGEGRNLRWFAGFDYNIWGIDMDVERLSITREIFPNLKENLIHARLSEIPFPDAHFDHIICSAVLHFAEDENHFCKMFSELIRVLKPTGSILIRTASNIGLRETTEDLSDSYNDRKAGYYLNRETISQLLDKYNLKLLEPIKTTNVQDIRAMTTLVLQK
ncbi:bifunctional 2-polyprenyl-6-hydroxyphenol methylase/3-demethylubiquinol 3-O-methyltransferase UbiG [uncultured Christiangramia sp.]|uniref:class I SAM-dependent methyltransferase n=1 Tax=Christiangramia sp. 3-2217-3z TaxID=3417564 RepID=UPI0026298E2C|nr:class I SAM-dependent methyltransferase [uncultured Christiangramia sp.]